MRTLFVSRTAWRLFRSLPVHCQPADRVDLTQASLRLRVSGCAEINAIHFQDLVAWQQTAVLSNDSFWEDFLYDDA